MTQNRFSYLSLFRCFGWVGPGLRYLSAPVTAVLSLKEKLLLSFYNVSLLHCEHNTFHQPAHKLGSDLGDEGGGGAAAGRGQRWGGVLRQAGRGRWAVVGGRTSVSKLSAVEGGAAGGSTREAGTVRRGAAAGDAEGWGWWRRLLGGAEGEGRVELTR